MERLQELRDMLSSFSENTRILSEFILDDLLFHTWTASASNVIHHYGTGGLLQHTYEVIKLCMANNEVFKLIGKGVDGELLFLAALYHDIGKLDSYERVPGTADDWRHTVDNRKVYHITRSALRWSKAVDYLRQSGKDYSWENEDQVLHAILAHHGRHEWKSPATPQDRTAWILHLCDAMSARVDDCIHDKYKKP